MDKINLKLPYEQYSGRLTALEIIRYSLYHDSVKFMSWMMLWMMNWFAFLIKDAMMYAAMDNKEMMGAKFKDG
jgi:hypothetical protein